MQAAFNARFTVEICDPHTEESRRYALARAVQWITQQIHAYGIGTANSRGGWYARLKQALDADITRLANDREKALFATASPEDGCSWGMSGWPRSLWRSQSQSSCVPSSVEPGEVRSLAPIHLSAASTTPLRVSRRVCRVGARHFARQRVPESGPF